MATAKKKKGKKRGRKPKSEMYLHRIPLNHEHFITAEELQYVIRTNDQYEVGVEFHPTLKGLMTSLLHKWIKEDKDLSGQTAVFKDIDKAVTRAEKKVEAMSSKLLAAATARAKAKG